ncbi:probable cytochrome P450 303a1 [Phlebotomus papatasi]|uniref:probable cytochrome P450 303a1 n=1 Tax=Phlebotomus papatasi TaxID=29031 RepID=UPI002483E6B7|nr:probable cytochrome P450 303a1 [Phlebotomus papatasi]
MITLGGNYLEILDYHSIFNSFLAKVWSLPGLLFFLTVILFLILDCRKPRDFPLGPFWYPIIGSALSLHRERERRGMLWKAIESIAQHYDKDRRGIVGFKVGKDRVAFVYTSAAIKDMMSREEIDGRPTGPFYETRTWNMRRGVLLTDEDFWMEQRRFVVRHLKEFGFARRGMVELIQREAEFLLEDMKNLVDSGGGSVLVEMQNLLNIYILNTLWTMMAGKRYSRDNQKLRNLQRILHELFASIDMMGAQFSHFPFLRYIAPEASGYKQFVECHKSMHEFVQEEVEHHKLNLKMDDEPNDLMDVYLRALNSPNKSDSFSEKQLLAICLDMFIAGSETTSKTLGFSILNLVRDQEVQRKMQEEIDTVVGRERLPKLEDRVNMPYCEAIVLEGLRFFMSNTFGIPHRALRDTTLCGYAIPKDTMVVASFFGMCRDPGTYADPEKFEPNHFLENGKVTIPDQYAPFGVGKRRCMGEMMARSNLFLFLTTLFQNFRIYVPEGLPPPPEDPIDGATPSVRQYKAVITYR